VYGDDQDVVIEYELMPRGNAVQAFSNEMTMNIRPPIGITSKTPQYRRGGDSDQNHRRRGE